MVDPGKHWRIRVYDRGFSYLGDWPNTATEPSFRSEVNRYTSAMKLDLAERDETGIASVVKLLTQNNKPLKTQDIILDNVVQGMLQLDNDDFLVFENGDTFGIDTNEKIPGRPLASQLKGGELYRRVYRPVFQCRGGG